MGSLFGAKQKKGYDGADLEEQSLLRGIGDEENHTTERTEPQPTALGLIPGLLPLLIRLNLAPEYVLINVIGLPIITLPLLLLRLVIFILRLFLGCSTSAQEPHQSITEQLSGNWDEVSGGYRAGKGKYASVWSRDSFFGLFAPIPERGDRLRALCDRLQRHMTTVVSAGPHGYGRSATGSPIGHVPYQFNETYYLASTFFGRAYRRSAPIVLFKDEKYGQPVMDVNAQ